MQNRLTWAEDRPIESDTLPPVTPAPYIVLSNFLAAEDHAALLRWTLESQRTFTASRVYTGVDETFRRSQVLADIGPFKMPFALIARNEYRDWVAQLGFPPFELAGVETELVAHNDGAHFSRHIDTRTVPGGGGSHRALSAVYYFYREPKAFTGGALRVFAADSSEDDTSVFADVEPVQNTMVIFPSWAAHQVMPVACASRAFADSRFAVNCWLHVRTAG